MMRRGFTLLEVLLASIILGLGLVTILVSMSQSQKMMLSSSYLETAQEVMDLGDMAYPLADVKDPEQDLDVREMKATELWDIVAGAHGPKMTREQEDKFHDYTWERVALNLKDSDEDIQRLGNLYTVRIIVRWGSGRTSKREEEGYVTFWRKKE